ncbi:uncharacterized protein [Dysidea avara]|uniref:uncharacterized protein isoform X2 n=1 Tax=Dysidea avara TaxID=196820 RepID=UPI00332C4A79
MNHFKLTGSPKCKNYMPRHRLADQYTVSATRTATTQATTGHETSGAISWMHWYRADDSGDTGKDLLQGRNLMTQLKEELRNETGITKYPSLTLQWECVTEGTTRSSKLEARRGAQTTDSSKSGHHTRGHR